MTKNRKAPSNGPPPPRGWRPGWTRAGEVVRFGARTFECLKDTPGRPSDRPRASHIWRPLD